MPKRLKKNMLLKKSMFHLFAIMFIVAVGIMWLVTVVFISVDVHDVRQTKTSISYTLYNDELCDCSNHGVCKLIIDKDLQVPPLSVPSRSTFDVPMALFSANIISCIEAPWSYDLPNKNTIILPQTLVLLHAITYESNNIGYVCQDKTDPTRIFITFRGTSTENEWAKDMEFSTVTNGTAAWTRSFIPYIRAKLGPESAGVLTLSHSVANHISITPELRIHKGFYDIYQNISSQLISAVPNTAVSIEISGHSLGGALACICAYESPWGKDIRTTTFVFGCPRVGNPVFADALDRIPGGVFRLSNATDIVCNIPVAVMPNFDDPKHPFMYQHGGTNMTFTDHRLSLAQNHLMPAYIAFLRSYNVIHT